MASRMEEFGFWLSQTFASMRAKRTTWPFVPGTYFVVNPQAPVAVTTLGSVKLAPEVAKSAPMGLCIVGKVETENIGLEKIIKNVLSDPAIRFLVCAGAEPPKHLTGATLIALFRNGVDERMKIIKERLLRIIEGKDARSIYLTLVRDGWVTRLDRAAYLGKELTKAELSIRHGIPFVQDGA